MATSASQKLNCLWPLHRGGKGWMRGALGRRLEAALWSFLRTPLGTYPWNPKYGTSIHRLRTQSEPYEDVEGSLLAELQMGIRQWIPDMTLIGVTVQMLPAKQKLEVKVSWGVRATGPEPVFAIGPVKTTVLI